MNMVMLIDKSKNKKNINLLHKEALTKEDFIKALKKASKSKCLKAQNLKQMGRGGFEPPTHGFSVRISRL